MDIVHVCVLEIERRVSGLRTWIMDDGGYGSRRRRDRMGREKGTEEKREL